MTHNDVITQHQPKQVAISVEQCGLHQRIALQALLTIGDQDVDADNEDFYDALTDIGSLPLVLILY